MSNTEKAEQQEISVEEKAAQIGKDIGVPEEQIPEYEIKVEEEEKKKADAAKTDASGNDDEGEEDDRLGKRRGETSGDKSDYKSLSNREKRQLRKKRLAQKFDAKDQLIRQQQEQINALANRLNDVDGKLSNFDRSQLEAALRDSQAAYAASEREYAEAFNAGDAQKATLSMRKMYETQKRVEQFQAIAARQQAAPRQQQEQVDANVSLKAQQWAAQNGWYRTDGSDEDSAIAQTVAARLVGEGFDPKTDDYWEELDDRLAQRGIGDGGYDREEPVVEQPKERVAKRRSSPPVGGTTGRGDLGGKQTVTLPTDFINNMKASGIWDDPVKKHRAIQNYMRIQSGG